jgi:Protein of unknown function (DUF3109)
MASRSAFFVRRHILPHITRLVADRALFEARFGEACSVSKCDAGCCRDGVFVDVEHRDVILAHADVIKRHMSPHQERDPDRWFEREIAHDPDFPSGKAVGTEAPAGCVFLNDKRRCVLHLADDAEDLPVTLKPFFCRLFPITICDGHLMLDEPVAGERPACCSATSGGDQTAFDLCRTELEMVLGQDGVEELRLRERKHDG